MKIGRWIGLGIFLSIVGVGITAVASTQVDFNQEIKKVFNLRKSKQFIIMEMRIR